MINVYVIVMRDLNTRLTLLAKLRNQQDDQSWEDFSSYYKDYLDAVIKKMGINHHDCEDLVQSVLLCLWQKLPEFEYDSQKGRFRSWLTQVALNHVRDFLKKSTRMQRAIQSGKEPLLEEYLKDKTPPELEEIFKTEWKRYISKRAWEYVSKELSDGVRESFELFMEGVEDSVIAEKLNLSASSVRVYRQRIRRKIAAEISRLEHELS